MDLIDRDRQNRILGALAAVYPGGLDAPALQLTEMTADIDALRVNLAYLEEHQLVTLKWQHYLSEPSDFGLVKITARGIDFIKNDGGLTAILGVQVVRLHDDTIRALLVSQVEASDADQTTKEALIEQVRRTPANMLGHVVERALDAALRSTPDVVRLVTQALAG